MDQRPGGLRGGSIRPKGHDTLRRITGALPGGDYWEQRLRSSRGSEAHSASLPATGLPPVPGSLEAGRDAYSPSSPPCRTALCGAALYLKSCYVSRAECMVAWMLENCEVRKALGRVFAGKGIHNSFQSREAWSTHRTVFPWKIEVLPGVLIF